MAEHHRNVALAVAIAEDGRAKYEIAAAAHVNTQTFGGVISGRVEPTEAVKLRIAEALDRPVDELFTESVVL